MFVNIEMFVGLQSCSIAQAYKEIKKIKTQLNAAYENKAVTLTDYCRYYNLDRQETYEDLKFLKLVAC